MTITGTHINYFFVCKRKLWYFVNGIYMEHESELVEEGKFIHETTYQGRSDKYKEISLEGIKVDYFDPKQKIIHEIKKSDKLEEAHIWQLKYYIWVFEHNGIEGVTGVLEYPKLKIKLDVSLSEDDEKKIENIIKEINRIAEMKEPPAIVKKKFCKSCSYYEFCFVKE